MTTNQQISDIDFNNYFYYDPSSPSGVRWKVSREQMTPYKKTLCKEGDTAGKQNNKGYWVISTRSLIEKGAKLDFLAHRVVYELCTGLKIPSNFDIDHFDRNTSNNLINNLRVVTRKLNCRNRGAIDGKIGGGVSLCVKKWPHPNEDKETIYYLARVTTDSGERIQKHFSTVKHGDEDALRLATEWRLKMIEQLNEQGAGYSPTHGQ